MPVTQLESSIETPSVLKLAMWLTALDAAYFVILSVAGIALAATSTVDDDRGWYGFALVAVAYVSQIVIIPPIVGACVAYATWRLVRR